MGDGVMDLLSSTYGGEARLGSKSIVHFQKGGLNSDMTLAVFLCIIILPLSAAAAGATEIFAVAYDCLGFLFTKHVFWLTTSRWQAPILSAMRCRQHHRSAPLDPC